MAGVILWCVSTPPIRTSSLLTTSPKPGSVPKSMAGPIASVQDDCGFDPHKAWE